MPRSIFLLPGVGAQGGRPRSSAPAFAPGAPRRLVAASRSIAGDPDPAARARAPAGAVWEVSVRLRSPSCRLYHRAPHRPAGNRCGDSKALARMLAVLALAAAVVVADRWSSPARSTTATRTTQRGRIRNQPRAGTARRRDKESRAKVLRSAERRHPHLDRPRDRGRSPKSSALNPEVDPQILIAGEKLKLRLSARRVGAGCGPAAFSRCSRSAPRPGAAQPRAGAAQARRQAPGRSSTRAPASVPAATRRDAVPIASATKLMTAYLALKELPLEKVVRAAPYAGDPRRVAARAARRPAVAVRDLLYGLILRSGNDAAVTLAGAVAGRSEQAFVRDMNLRAAALGLADTHYSNPIGLDEPGNYSSARDLVDAEPAAARDPGSSPGSPTPERAVLRSLIRRETSTPATPCCCRPLGDRREDRPHARGRLRPRRLRRARAASS